jgi:uncharacterized lipoprotein YddW (UPF0748 family)
LKQKVKLAMLATAAFAAATWQQGAPSPRLQTAAPLRGIAWARIDTGMAGVGILQGLARQQGLQGRVLWIDATANLGRVNTEEKIRDLVAKVADVGFNTIVYDVKPIVGRTVYPSSLTEQLVQWRDQTLPPGFDPVAPMRREAKARGLSFLVSLNAFSEGHSFAKRDEDKPGSVFGDPGWGYRNRHAQTVQYEPHPAVVIDGKAVDIQPTMNPSEPDGRLMLFDRAPAGLKPSRSVVVSSSGEVVSVHEGAPEKLEPGQRALAEPPGAAEKGPLSSVRPGQRLRLTTTHRFVPIADAQRQIPLMMNPHLKSNQDRALEFVREVVSRYRPDGVLFDDRLRYGGLNADFSESTRAAFEQRVGARLEWPDDVFRYTTTWDLRQGVRLGPWFDAWMAWRAEEMGRFVARAKQAVKSAAPGTLFGVYAGSWYGDYPQYGANWGSPDLWAGFPFLTRAYRQTGFAANLDLLITGCYYRIATQYQALERAAPPGRTVEAGGIVSNRAVRDQCWVYAGIMLADYAHEPRMLEHALQAACETTQGVMVFDLSHDIDRYWEVFKRAFAERRPPPHTRPETLERGRRRRAEWDRAGYRDAPFPLFEGMPGAGF